MTSASQAASERTKIFAEGCRVDCLYDGEYYRGTTDSTRLGESGGDLDGSLLFRVCFDDGDVRDDVPPGELEAPLSVGARVECFFEVFVPLFDACNE